MVISEVEQVAVCVACNLHIKDRYLFEVTNRKWHCVCLRCTHCKCLLTEKCWLRQNNLYCKDDYYKLFFSCSTCKQAIERDTYVRKTSSMIFHLQCFQCAQCGKVLDSGDHYIVSEDKLLCSNHYPNQLLSLSNSKNSLAELITDQEGEIVVKTEQSNLNTSIDNQPAGQQANQPIPFTSLSPPTSVLDSLTMSNAITQSHPASSPFLLSRSQQPPVSSSLSGSNSLSSLNNSLNIHHPTMDPHHLHGAAEADRPQSLSLIDYSSHHQPPSIGKLTNSLTDFEANAADFYSSQPPSAACYPPNGPLSAHNPHLLGNLYEHEALRFYGGAGCIQPPMSAPTPNSPLNEIENTHGPSNGIVLGGGGARKGRPRKRKQIGLASSNTGIDAISAALHEQNLNNLNSSNSSVIAPNLVNSINSGHMQNSNSSNSSTSSSNGNHQRTKRMRTSFKHSQLKMMKQYFGKNQNPDAKDLKALAQDTGLTKRVLQVWFQNQRAKYRRTNPGKGECQFSQGGLPLLNQTLLGSPENGSTRQFSTPSPASIISNNSISNNQSSTMQCETSLPANHSSALCSNGSSSSLDQYSPSNSISLLRHTPPPSVKALQQPSSPSMVHLAPSALHFGHHLASNHPSNGLAVNSMPNRHLTNFSSEQIMSTFQDLY